MSRILTLLPFSLAVMNATTPFANTLAADVDADKNGNQEIQAKLMKLAEDVHAVVKAAVARHIELATPGIDEAVAKLKAGEVVKGGYAPEGAIFTQEEYETILLLVEQYLPATASDVEVGVTANFILGRAIERAHEVVSEELSELYYNKRKEAGVATAPATITDMLAAMFGINPDELDGEFTENDLAVDAEVSAEQPTAEQPQADTVDIPVPTASGRTSGFEDDSAG